MVQKDRLVFVNAHDQKPVPAGKLAKPLGSGAYGKVFLVRLGDQVYAYKELHNSQAQVVSSKGCIEATDELAKEMSIMLGLDHPNVMKLRLYVLANDGAGYLMDYVKEGDLLHYIKQGRNEGFSMVRWLALGIAKGLADLHRKGIIHRDLHIKNVLVHNGQAVITDFGCGKNLLDGDNTTKYAGMLAIVPPEVRDQTSETVNVACSYDMYGYGLLMAQVVRAVTEPALGGGWRELRDDEGWKRDHVHRAVLACNKAGESELREVILGCVIREGPDRRRPTAQEVVDRMMVGGVTGHGGRPDKLPES